MWFTSIQATDKCLIGVHYIDHSYAIDFLTHRHILEGTCFVLSTILIAFKSLHSNRIDQAFLQHQRQSWRKSIISTAFHLNQTCQIHLGPLRSRWTWEWLQSTKVEYELFLLKKNKISRLSASFLHDRVSTTSIWDDLESLFSSNICWLGQVLPVSWHYIELI